MAERRHEGTRVRRCAIYTRKSSEEGLEQDFNSLDAQREACAAYISSQQHEGWRAVPESYDDGGKSGATLERAALQRLLDDIRRQRVDIIVVYKVDRLTRSLADFAKLVEVFDAHAVSFVSITQQFNTTTSMGRLTLNVLLSFAQFEREVTAERIRDKLAASKKKGLWMGGVPPLGYDVHDRQLVVNETEAETVRCLYRRYLELGAVAELKTDLDAAGIVSKRTPRRGGTPMQRGALYRLLSNPLYCGQVQHKDMVYPGQHPAIVDEALWTAVQSRLRSNCNDASVRPKATHASLLSGIAFDGAGHRLTPSHAVKNGRRYRYYLSQPLTTSSKTHTREGLRLPAVELEREVTRHLCRHLLDRPRLGQHLTVDQPSAITLARRLDVLAHLGENWTTLPTVRRRTLVLTLLRRVVVTHDHLALHLNLDALQAVADEQAQTTRLAPAPPKTSDDDEATFVLSASIRLCHVKGGLKLVLAEGRHDEPHPNDKVVKLLKTAHRYLASVRAAEVESSIKTLAAHAKVSDSYFTAVLRLAWLAPDITQALLAGRHPPELNVGQLMKHSRHLPLEWAKQRGLLKLDRA